MDSGANINENLDTVPWWANLPCVSWCQCGQLVMGRVVSPISPVRHLNDARDDSSSGNVIVSCPWCGTHNQLLPIELTKAEKNGTAHQAKEGAGEAQRTLYKPLQPNAL